MLIGIDRSIGWHPVMFNISGNRVLVLYLREGDNVCGRIASLIAVKHMV